MWLDPDARDTADPSAPPPDRVHWMMIGLCVAGFLGLTAALALM